MEQAPLTIQVSRDNLGCVLKVAGQIDMLTAPRLVNCAAGALPEGPGLRVLDLAGLTFLDCAGARALEAIVRASPAGYPVIMRSVSPQTWRLLGVMGFNASAWTVRASTSIGGRRARKLRQQAQVTRAQSRQLVVQALRLANALAESEYEVAVTLAELAEQRPDYAARLRALSQAAQMQAADYRALSAMASPGYRG